MWWNLSSSAAESCWILFTNPDHIRIDIEKYLLKLKIYIFSCFNLFTSNDKKNRNIILMN
jgi:hypothetical protein